MYLYPKWIRAWHLLNAAMFLILIVTGISMQYTDKENAAYVVGFAKAVKWHNFAAIVLVLNYIFFVTGNLLTQNGKYYRIGEKVLSQIWKSNYNIIHVVCSKVKNIHSR